MTLGERSTICGCVLGGMLAASADAAILFYEDFENYSVSGETNAGLPLQSEGAMETWYGGRFQSHDGGSIDDDIAIRRLPSSFPDQGTYARFEDEAGILFNISTVGYNNIQLSFDWLTHIPGSADKLVVGFYVGNINFTGDTPDGANDNLVHRFDIDGPAWSQWTELMRDNNTQQWETANFALPSNTSSIWVAFWLDNGEGDYGKIDEVQVTGTPIPAPGAMALLALSSLTARTRRRCGKV